MPQSTHTTPDTTSESYCPHCATAIACKPWPVEPLYTIKDLVVLIPCASEAAVRHALSTHKHHLTPAVYCWDGSHRRRRLVPASDVRRLRDLIVRRSIR